MQQILLGYHPKSMVTDRAGIARSVNKRMTDELKKTLNHRVDERLDVGSREIILVVPAPGPNLFSDPWMGRDKNASGKTRSRKGRRELANVNYVLYLL